MKYFVLILFLLASISLKAQKNESEKWQFEAAINMSSYNSLSISIEKEFSYYQFKFGPRIELLNPFGNLVYRVSGDTNTYQQVAQIRIRAIQIEWCVYDRIRIGVSPFWMLGPLPRRGYYKTPSSVYTHFDLDKEKTLSAEITLSTSPSELAQISIRKVF